MVLRRRPTGDLRRLPRDRGLSRVHARLGCTEWTTALLPEGDGTQFLPLEAAVRRAERVDLGDEITVEVW